MAANVRFFKPEVTLAKPPGYSYVVEATGPNWLIFIAGGKLFGSIWRIDRRQPRDFRAQANKAVENLKLAPAAAGATLKATSADQQLSFADMSHTSLSSARCARRALQHVCAAR